MRRSLLVLVPVAVVLVVISALVSTDANDRERDPVPDAAACDLPAPDPKLKPHMVPEVARVSAEIVALETSRRWVSGTLNVPMSVRDLLDSLLKRARASNYRILSQDYEGFEAELFVARNGKTGVLRILISSCPDLSRLLFQLPRA